MISGANIMSATKISAIAAQIQISNLSQRFLFFIADVTMLKVPESSADRRSCIIAGRQRVSALRNGHPIQIKEVAQLMHPGCFGHDRGVQKRIAADRESS